MSLSSRGLLEARTLSREEILGIQSTAPPIGNSPAQSSMLPEPPLLMIDRVTEIIRDKGQERICAELDVPSDAWFYAHHFPNDPILPGSFILEGLWQLLVLYCSLIGARGVGRALGVGDVIFERQFDPADSTIRYELDIRKVMYPDRNGNAQSVADGAVYAGAETLCKFNRLKAGIFSK